MTTSKRYATDILKNSEHERQLREARGVAFRIYEANHLRQTQYNLALQAIYYTIAFDRMEDEP